MKPTSAESQNTTSSKVPPLAYSCYFELELPPKRWGLSRKKHNVICNQALLKHLEAFEREGIQFYPEVSNQALIQGILTERKTESPHETLTWEHCSTSTTNGRKGIMRLVPKSQHNVQSDHWRTIHPDYKCRGGYHEWAVPAGAPPEGARKVDVSKIPSLTRSQLSEYLSKTLYRNSFKDFWSVLVRAESICNHEQLENLLTTLHSAHIGKPETLLHIAARNGSMAFVNTIIQRLSYARFLNSTNYRGNTPAHEAAKANRSLVLKKLQRAGADLAIKNSRQRTPYDIAKARGFASCLPYCMPSHDEEASLDQEGKGGDTQTEATGRSVRDPAFTFAGLSNRYRKAKPPSTSARAPINTNDAMVAGNYTFKDVMRKQFGERTAAHFIAQAEAFKKQKTENLPPAEKYTFKDVLRKQCGERAAAHLIAQAEAFKKQKAEKLPAEKYTFKDVLRKQCGERAAAHLIAQAEAFKKQNAERPSAAANYTFKDVLKKQCGERAATHLITQAEEARKQNAAKAHYQPGFFKPPQTRGKQSAQSTQSFPSQANIRKEQAVKHQVNPLPQAVREQKQPSSQPSKRVQESRKSAVQPSLQSINKSQGSIPKVRQTMPPSRVSQGPASQVVPPPIRNFTQSQRPAFNYQSFFSETRQQRAHQAERNQPQVQQQRVKQAPQQPQRVQQAARPPQRAHAVLQRTQPHVQQQRGQQAQQQAQQKAQQAQQRAQQQAQQRMQQAQQRAQQQAQQRAQQTQQRAQQQAQQKAQQAQQRAQQEAQQKAQQAQQRAQQQAQQRAQQQAQQRAQQQAQQKTQQTQQRAQEAQNRAQQARQQAQAAMRTRR